MTNGRLLAVGLLALAGATAMLMHPDVPVGVLGGTGLRTGVLFVLLAWTGAGLLVVCALPRRGGSGLGPSPPRCSCLCRSTSCCPSGPAPRTPPPSWEP